MRKAEIDALVLAHRGRARPVAFFHVLRQPELSADDHAFLLEHVEALGASDLLRWRARCTDGTAALVIRQLAHRAVADPQSFQHEVLDLPKIELGDHEWADLAERVKGRVPAAVYEGIVARGGERPVRPAPETFFTPGVIRGFDAAVDDTDGEALEEAIRTLGVQSLPIRDILVARKAGSVTLDDTALLALALARAGVASEDWSAAAPDFPALLKDAVLEKARSTPRSAERANLLTWLEMQEVPRATLLPIALATIGEGPVSYGLVGWLARQLSTRAAWEEHGFAVLSALVAQRAFPEVGELIAVVWSEAGRGQGEPPRALLEAIQAAFARTLLAIIQTALDREDEGRAMAALSALSCLDPPAHVRRAARELRPHAGASAALRELLGVNERHVEYSDARDASLEGVVAALHAVADAFT